MNRRDTGRSRSIWNSGLDTVGTQGSSHRATKPTAKCADHMSRGRRDARGRSGTRTLTWPGVPCGDWDSEPARWRHAAENQPRLPGRAHPSQAPLHRVACFFRAQDGQQLPNRSSATSARTRDGSPNTGASKHTGARRATAPQYWSVATAARRTTAPQYWSLATGARRASWPTRVMGHQVPSLARSFVCASCVFVGCDVILTDNKRE